MEGQFSGQLFVSQELCSNENEALKKIYVKRVQKIEGAERENWVEFVSTGKVESYQRGNDAGIMTEP